MTDRTVPCNGCRACCLTDLIILHPECGDRPDDYQTVDVSHPFTGQRVKALARKANLECVYLDDQGCTIHDRAPAICREFDCRRMYLGYTRAERKRMVRDGLMGKDVFEAGRERLASLENGSEFKAASQPKRRDQAGRKSREDDRRQGVRTAGGVAQAETAPEATEADHCED